MRLPEIFLFSWLLVLGAVTLQAAPSPWDSWRSGYTNFEQGEALRESGRYSDALEKFETARKSYLAVRAARPDWNQRVIADRLRDCDAQIAEVRRLLGGNNSDLQKKLPETQASSEPGKDIPTTIIRNQDNGGTKELFQAKAELERLRQELNKQRNLEAEITALLRDRRIADEKFSLLEKRYLALQKQQKTPDAAVAHAENIAVQEKMESERARRRYEAAEQQLAEVNEKLQEAVLKANAAEKMLRRSEDELKRKNSELLRSREELGKIIGKIKSPQDENSDGKSGTQQLDNLVNMLHQLNDQLSKKEKQLVMVQEELQKEVNSGRISAVELANLREHNRRLEKDVKLYSDRLQEVQIRLERRNSEEFRAAAAANDTKMKLEKELLSSQKELVSLRGSIDAKQRDLENAVRKSKSLESEVISARAAVMQMEQQLKHSKISQQELLRVRNELDKLRRNFTALSAENKENRALAEAAKPREAELANAKLRLLEMDRLKGELAKEQQISAELKSAYSKNQSELKSLRSKAAGFEASRRRLIELESVAKEVENLRKLELELDHIKGREAELAKAKIKLSELENSLRQSQAAIIEAERYAGNLKREVAALKKENSGLLKLQRVNEELKALIANQGAELDSLKRSGKSGEVPGAGAQRYSELAAKIGTLNDQLQQQQHDFARKEEILSRRIAKLSGEITGKTRMLELKDKELADVKKINAELADYRKNSVDALRDKVDLSRISRLEDELASLGRLNAELAAERDKLIAEAERKQNANETVVTVMPKISPEQLASSGVIAESDGNFELALWNYQQALAADPDFVPAHLRLGSILFSRGSYQEALPHLSAAFAAAPQDTALAKTIARCQIRLGRFGNARSVIEPLLIRQKNDAVVQMCAALIDAGIGKFTEAEERLHTAIRLAPESAEIRLELARLLASSVTDRRGEAALEYENARRLGSAPDPQLEKTLGSLLDHRREVMRFMSSAAGEAELDKDWNAAVWYYKKLIAEKHYEFIPHLALAQWKSGNVSGAKETLEFHKPSREAMVVRALIALEENDEALALDAARQAAGAKPDPGWVGMNYEISSLKRKIFKSAAVKALLQGIKE